MPVRFFDRSSDSSDGDSLTGGYLCSHCETRFCNYCLIRFLRGLLINHDTQPQPIAIQSKPIAPGSVLNAALSRTQHSLIDSLSVHKVRRNSQKTSSLAKLRRLVLVLRTNQAHQIVSVRVGLEARRGTPLLCGGQRTDPAMELEPNSGSRCLPKSGGFPRKMASSGQFCPSDPEIWNTGPV